MMKWSQLLCADTLNRHAQDNHYEGMSMDPFERDYYTIVTSTYFRRLQRKTQVYVLDENDYSRNRLTHSLEVSVIAEMMGRRVGKFVEERESELPDRFVDNLAMVLRCAGLLHDLGNPPFGHSGEDYIRDYFLEHKSDYLDKLDEQMWLDFINFDGNAHNLRIATKLGKSSKIGSDYYGMELTCAVLNSIIKYPISSLAYTHRTVDENTGKKLKGKIGYYHAEDWIVGILTKKTGTKAEDGAILKDPIMLLMEAADDIAYATADVDDAIAKKLLRKEDVLLLLKDNVPEEIVRDDEKNAERNDDRIPSTLKYVRETTMDDVVHHFEDNYDSIMEGTYSGELIDQSTCDIKGLKKLLRDIYKKRDEDTERNLNAKAKIFDILDYLIKSVTSEDQTFHQYLVSRELKQYIDKGEREADNACKYGGMREKEEYYHKLLAVVDFVSGMTDSYVSIFSKNLHSDAYWKLKEDEYKSFCLKAITHVSEYKEANHAFDYIGNVDDWDDYELSVILRSYLHNGQVRNAFEGKKIIPKLYRKLKDNIGNDSILTPDEILQLDALPD